MAALHDAVTDAGLMERCPRYYTLQIATILGIAFAGALLLTLCHSAIVRSLCAPLFGFVSVQLAFLGHDLAHGQITSNARAKRRYGLLIGNFLTGISHTWWLDDHRAHHSYPNDPERDPTARILTKWLVKCPYLYILVAPVGALSPLVASLAFILRSVRQRRAEAASVAVHYFAFLGVTFAILPPVVAAVFILLFYLSFGMYLAIVETPNHRGRPLQYHSDADPFAARQGLATGNIESSRWQDYFYGGLNFHIEHHLFPTMPRPQLRRASDISRSFLTNEGIPYQTASLLDCYREAFRLAREPRRSDTQARAHASDMPEGVVGTHLQRCAHKSRTPPQAQCHCRW